MNNDTIKAVGKALTEYETLLIQKDEQIKELVDGISEIVNADHHNLILKIMRVKQLIEKYKQAR